MRMRKDTTMLSLVLVTLLTIVPFTAGKPFSKPGTNGVADTATNRWIWDYNQRVWSKQVVRHDSPDNVIRPTRKPNKNNQVNWCDFRAMWRPETSIRIVTSATETADHCHEIPEVSGKNAESPCHNLDMDNSPMMGMWGSPDIECELYFDDWCQKSVKHPNGQKGDKLEFAWNTLGQGGNTWGHDNMDSQAAIWRKKGNGFNDKLGFEGFGPKSLRCWLKDKPVQVGLSNNKNSNVEQGKPLRKRHTGEELPPESEQELSIRIEQMLAGNASDVFSAMD